MATLAELRNQGWHVDEKKLDNLLQGEEDVDLKKLLLDSDMRDYGEAVLLTKLDRQANVLEAGTYVFQLTRQRNVYCPEESLTSHQNGLYKYIFSDGYSSISALRFDPIPGLTEKTMPGTKVLLSGPITLESDLLLITPSNCRVIGGKVERLILKWQMEQFGLTRTGLQSDAPKWISFNTKKNKPRKDAEKEEKLKNFKTTDVLNKAYTRDRSADEKAAEDEFTSDRKALINDLEKEHPIKRFPSNSTLDRSWSSSESLKRSKSRSTDRLNVRPPPRTSKAPASAPNTHRPRSAQGDRPARGQSSRGRGRARGTRGGRGRGNAVQDTREQYSFETPDYTQPPPAAPRLAEFVPPPAAVPRTGNSFQSPRNPPQQLIGQSQDATAMSSDSSSGRQKKSRGKRVIYPSSQRAAIRNQAVPALQEVTHSVKQLSVMDTNEKSQLGAMAATEICNRVPVGMTNPARHYNEVNSRNEFGSQQRQQQSPGQRIEFGQQQHQPRGYHRGSRFYNSSSRGVGRPSSGIQEVYRHTPAANPDQNFGSATRRGNFTRRAPAIPSHAGEPSPRPTPSSFQSNDVRQQNAQYIPRADLYSPQELQPNMKIRVPRKDGEVRK